ncbi:unnamed protein product [Rhizopus stolonifer]
MDNINNIEWFNTNSDMVNALIQLSEVPENQVQKRPSTVSFEPTLSIVQSDDRFVNLSSGTPSIPKAKKPNKKRFQETVFVTESPQKTYKKKADMSSSESEDEQIGSPSKRMSSKERRQLRNKISARNFRVRRKEYITQLEQKLDEQERIIQTLREENTKLRKSNEEFMQQILSQPPLATTSDELISSSSEGQSSPEPLTNLPFQFPMNDLYDLSLFDQPEQPQQPVFNIESFNSLFFNHAVMPDWDLHRLVSDKIKPTMSEYEKRESAEELLSEYPLIGAALMSIVLRHTMTLDYVASMSNMVAKSEFKTKSEPSQSKALPMIEPASNEFDTSAVTNEELMTYILTYYYKNYVFARARGIQHDQILENWRGFITNHEHCTRDFFKKMRNKDMAKKESRSKPGKLQTFHTYCKVAGSLLKRPQRMAHINKVLKETMQLPQNEHTQRIEKQYVSMMNRTSKLRISTN